MVLKERKKEKYQKRLVSVTLGIDRSIIAEMLDGLMRGNTFRCIGI